MLDVGMEMVPMLELKKEVTGASLIFTNGFEPKFKPSITSDVRLAASARSGYAVTTGWSFVVPIATGPTCKPNATNFTEMVAPVDGSAVDDLQVTVCVATLYEIFEQTFSA
jgi:hypothetical protein